jgi:hypothetical protein
MDRHQPNALDTFFDKGLFGNFSLFGELFQMLYETSEGESTGSFVISSQLEEPQHVG